MSERPKLDIYDDPSGEWAALYVDGNLHSYGDRDNPIAHAMDLAGITVVYSDAFLLGTDGRDGVATTLAEIDDFQKRRAQTHTRAVRIREQAAALIAEAEKLESQ